MSATSLDAAAGRSSSASAGSSAPDDDAACRRERRHAVAALAVLYFLGAAGQTFPLTAYAGLLNVDLKMPQPEQSLYYAITYVPWALKPAYGLLSDELPIFHMKPISEKKKMLRVVLNNTVKWVVIKTSTCDGSGGLHFLTTPYKK